jgi:hypothetical protein
MMRQPGRLRLPRCARSGWTAGPTLTSSQDGEVAVKRCLSSDKQVPERADTIGLRADVRFARAEATARQANPWYQS